MSEQRCSRPHVVHPTSPFPGLQLGSLRRLRAPLPVENQVEPTPTDCTAWTQREEQGDTREEEGGGRDTHLDELRDVLEKLCHPFEASSKLSVGGAEEGVSDKEKVESERMKWLLAMGSLAAAPSSPGEGHQPVYDRRNDGLHAANSTLSLLQRSC